MASTELGEVVFSCSGEGEGVASAELGEVVFACSGEGEGVASAEVGEVVLSASGVCGTTVVSCSESLPSSKSMSSLVVDDCEACCEDWEAMVKLCREAVRRSNVLGKKK